jgi:hypothetical protein
VGNGLLVLIEYPAAKDQRWIAAVQVVRREFQLDRALLRIESFAWLDRGIAFGDDQKTEKKLGIQVLQDKLALPVTDRLLDAVRVAGRSEIADTLPRARGANEDGGTSYGLAGVIFHHPGEVGGFGNGANGTGEDSE